MSTSRPSTSASRLSRSQLPNLPHPSVPEGKSEDDNVEVRRWGTPRQFAFTPKPHEEIGADARPASTSSAPSRSPRRASPSSGVPAARLERALAQFMLDLHTREHGYTELWVPHLVSGDTMLQDRPAPQVRGRPLQDRRARRQPSALSDPHLGGAADGPSQWGDPRRAAVCPCAIPHSRPAIDARRAPTVRT